MEITRVLQNTYIYQIDDNDFLEWLKKYDVSDISYDQLDLDLLINEYIEDENIYGDMMDEMEIYDDRVNDIKKSIRKEIKRTAKLLYNTNKYNL